jgi:glutathione S-transferase
MMNYPWFAALLEHAPDTLDGADAVQEWMARMAERAAVKKGMAI